MGLGGCYSCIKYLMFAFNFLFWLLGCAILGVGIWVRCDPNFEQYVNSSATDFSYLYTGSYILITVGLVVMALGFLGCCGAIRESQWMLVTFFFMLLLIFTLLLGTGIWAIIAKESLKQSVVDTLKTAVQQYNTDAASKKFLDTIMKSFECCGADNGAPDFMLYQHEVPPKSCKIFNYAQPCHDKLFNFFSENSKLLIVAGLAIGVAVIMIVGMVFSMLLCCCIREADQRWHQ